MPDERDPLAFPPPGSGVALYQFKFADALFDESRFELRMAGTPVTVEPRPLRVLAELLRHAGEVVTKEELFESVWEGRVTVDNVLANAVTKLRKALGDEAGSRLVNVPRVGYRLTGPVERIALAVNPASLPALKPGLAVPGRANFQLVQALGEGGQGRVWLARQPKTGQERVFKFAVDSQGLASLKREYTLARVLRSQLGPRADLVAVHEAHFAEAPFSIECEYVGPDLLRWEAQTGSLAGMALSQRLALFLQIARTVSFAHGLGVLHKDIKPANVLLRVAAHEPTLVLADFGSGHLADAERVRQWGITAMGMTVQGLGAPDTDSGGTLMYLAPEVLAGQASTVQSDVYALGVLLYQMVTADLQRTMTGGWQRDLDNPLLLADIEAATERDPARRLESAGALADRLAALDERRQAADAARATAQRLAEAQAAEQRRLTRRPWQVAAVLALVLGSAGALYLERQTRHALKIAETEQARAAAIRDFVQRDLLESPDILTQGTVRPTTMLQVLRRAADSAAERFAQRPVDEAAIRRRLAEAFMRIASLSDAGVQLNKALSLLTPLVPPDDEERLTLLFLSAHLQAWGMRFDDARAQLELAERLAGPQRLAQASEMSYQALRARYELAYWTDTLPQALPVAERLVVVTDAVFPNTAHLRVDARYRQAEALYFSARQAEAVALASEVTRPPLNGRDFMPMIKSRHSRVEGQRLAAEGRWREVAVKQAEVRDALASQRPVNDYHLAWADASLASIQHRLGDFKAAQANLRRAIAGFEQTNGEGHQYVATYRLLTAFNLLQLDRPSEAVVILDDVADWMRTEGKPLFTRSVVLARGMALRKQGRAREALALFENLAPDPSDWHWFAAHGAARIQGERGLALLALGRHAEAAQALQSAVADLEKAKSWDWLIAEYRQALRLAQAKS